MFMFLKKIKWLVVVILLGMGSLVHTFAGQAFVMGSDNYRVQNDSINIGGLDNSSSTSYRLKDTVGELATGFSESDNYKMYVGYRQMDEVSLSLSVLTNVNLLPNINGLVGGSATSTTNWTVNTDNSAGYLMSLKAFASPAMTAGVYSFTDYTPAVIGTPDFNWDITNTNSAFGFSVYNTTGQMDKFKNNGTVCSLGTNIVDERCWYGLSITDEPIVNRMTRTDVGGDITKVNFKAEVNTVDGFQVEGNYSATIIVTVVSN